MRKFLFYSASLLLLLSSAEYSFAQFSYIFPKNDTKNHFPLTHIILRNGELMDASSVTADKIVLTGSKSGVIPANVVLSTDGKTVCVTPAVPFAYSESVSVTVNDGLSTLSGNELTGTSFNFSIRREMTTEEKHQLEEYLSTHDEAGDLKSEPRQATYVPNENASTRGTQFSSVLYYTNTTPYGGRIFFHRNSGLEPEGYGIMDYTGDSLFYRESATDGSNFQLNLNGMLTAYREEDLVDTTVLVIDSNYNVLYDVHCGNGLSASQHEHLFLPNGEKWFTIHDWQLGWDLSSYGGSTSASVNVSWIQRLDANNNVTFTYRSFDDFDLDDAAPDIFANITTQFYSPHHVNSIYIDQDGKLIVSFRNMDVIVKIDLNGNIVWKWGGVGWAGFSDIATLNDPDGGFSHQHYVKRIDDGHILLFDNGNLHVPPVTKPKEYILDETALTADCTWYYEHPQVNGFNMYTKQQGSVQRLPNGNTFIGYGLPNIAGLPNATEIDVNKNIVFEFRFKDSTEYSYRLYKQGWYSVGTSDIDASDHPLQLFPNPSDGIINLDFHIPVSGNVTISVFNVLGQTAYSKTEKYSSGTHNTALDFTYLNQGIYFIEVSAGEMKRVGRILIQ